MTGRKNEKGLKFKCKPISLECEECPVPSAEASGDLDASELSLGSPHLHLKVPGHVWNAKRKKVVHLTPE